MISIIKFLSPLFTIFFK